VLARAATAAGALELRRRGEADFLIAVDGRVLMTSRTARSEAALGELAVSGLADRAAPRVSVEIGDVAAALRPGAGFDAIALDLFEGPDPAGPHFGAAALARAHAALAPEGVLAVWSERPDPAFERRLAAAGFAVSRARPGRGGLRHAVYRAVRGPGTPADRWRGRAAHRRS
jgi:spermidine synthase